MEILNSDIGKIVRHKLTKEKVIVIGTDNWNRKAEIRRLDYTTVLVREQELEPYIEEEKQ